MHVVRFKLRTRLAWTVQALKRGKEPLPTPLPCPASASTRQHPSLAHPLDRGDDSINTQSSHNLIGEPPSLRVLLQPQG